MMYFGWTLQVPASPSGGLFLVISRYPYGHMGLRLLVGSIAGKKDLEKTLFAPCYLITMHGSCKGLF